MFAHKLMAFMAWLGIFTTPAKTADYDLKSLDVSCVTHKVRTHPDNKVDILGAIKLTSQNDDFGGLSGILLPDDPKSLFYAISDRSRFFTAKPIYEKNALKCLEGVTIRPLRGRSKAALIGHHADSEGLSFANKSQDQIYVSFERVHRVVRYHLKDKQLLPRYDIKALDKEFLPYNLSYEAVRWLGDEYILALPEQYIKLEADAKSNAKADEKDSEKKEKETTKDFTGFLYNKKTKKDHEITIKNRDDHGITDIAILKNGDFVLLERYISIFSGISVQIRHIPKEAFFKKDTAENPIDGEIIFRIHSNLGGDNFEGLAVRQDEKGDYLYLISDDNFTSLQKTLIMSLFYPSAVDQKGDSPNEDVQKGEVVQ